LDDAVFLNVNREKEIEQQVAKQTIRIKAPVTSELLQDKLDNLRIGGHPNDTKKEVEDL